MDVLTRPLPCGKGRIFLNAARIKKRIGQAERQNACMQREVLRAWWSHKQGLDQQSKVSAHKILEQTGWARSVGGVNPYLTIFSRTGLSREAIDKALAKQEIHELPSAR